MKINWWKVTINILNVAALVTLAFLFLQFYKLGLKSLYMAVEVVIFCLISTRILIEEVLNEGKS